MLKYKFLSSMINIDVVVKNKSWNKEKEIEKFIVKTTKKLILATELKNFVKRKIDLELAVLLVSDRKIKELNLQYRGKNKTTDILSFPSLDEKLIRKNGIEKLTKACDNLFLGDIIISYGVVKKEALLQNKKFSNHLTHLLLHSILHLIGYDHENAKMAKIMEDKEIKILRQLKIKNPYEFNKE